jgi:hypothetical protein
MTDDREFARISLRSEFQSLFWNIFSVRKRQTGFTFKALADALGINKSYVSRSFSSPPNWQIDKLSDMAEALGVELIVEARDKNGQVIYSASGIRPAAAPVNTETSFYAADKLERQTAAADAMKAEFRSVVA